MSGVQGPERGQTQNFPHVDGSVLSPRGIPLVASDPSKSSEERGPAYPTHCEDDGSPLLEDLTCSKCGVGHSEQCPECRRWGFHSEGCPEIFDRSSLEHADATAKWRFLSPAAGEFVKAFVPIILLVPLWVIA